MSNVVNSAFTVIRAATHMRRPPLKTVVHTDEGSLTVHKLPSILPTPLCSPWRHPIWWWKLRHLRADLRLREEELGNDPAAAALNNMLEKKMNDAFLNGSGN